MMRLRHSATSPFVRKVMVAAIELGLDDEIERVPTDVWSPDTDIAKDNPLKKVPALATDDGTFVDSTLICRYLDARAGGRLFPAPGEGWPVLQLYALADGVIEAAVGHVVESLRRPKEFVFQGCLDRQLERIRDTLTAIELSHDFDSGRIDIASITLGAALGYLDFRLGDLQWRKSRPQLAAFDETFSARPSMQATLPRL